MDTQQTAPVTEPNASKKPLMIAVISIAAIMGLVLLLFFTDTFVGKAIHYEGGVIQIEPGQVGLTEPHTGDDATVTTTEIVEGSGGTVDIYTNLGNSQSLLGRVGLAVNPSDKLTITSNDVVLADGLTMVGDVLVDDEGKVSFMFRASPEPGDELTGVEKIASISFIAGSVDANTDITVQFTDDTTFLDAGGNNIIVIGDNCADGLCGPEAFVSSEFTITNLVSCGDGEVEAPEQCDDGNEDNTDGCMNACLLDDDGDEVPNDNDNCPAVLNVPQEDADRDGLGDACDDTPCGDHASLTDVCVCDVGYENANNDWVDGCEAESLLVPSVVINAPGDGASVTLPLTVDFTISNWDVGESTHFHLFIDDADQGPVLSPDPVVIEALAEGDHTITLTLAHADHSFTGGRLGVDGVSASVAVTVVSPDEVTLSIVDVVPVSPLQYDILFTTTNHLIDDANHFHATLTNADGTTSNLNGADGDNHYYLADAELEYDGATQQYTFHATIPDAAARTITLELRDVNHGQIRSSGLVVKADAVLGGVCTGVAPENALLCAGDGEMLLGDAGISLVPACTGDLKCEYTCDVATNFAFNAETGSCTQNEDDEVCDAVHLDLCTTQNECTIVGFWYDDGDGNTDDCYAQCPAGTADDGNKVCLPEDDAEKQACLDEDRFWYDECLDACPATTHDEDNDKECISNILVTDIPQNNAEDTSFETTLTAQKDLSQTDIGIFTKLEGANGKTLVIKYELIEAGVLTNGKAITSTVDYANPAAVMKKKVIVFDKLPGKGQTVDGKLETTYP